MPPAPVLLMARELGVGGTERQLAEIARALDRARFSPHVACFRGGGFRAEELAASGVPVHDLGLRSFFSPSLAAAARRLGALVGRHGIRLVHTFDVPANLFGVPAARAFRVPVVLSSQRADRALAGEAARHLLRLTDLLVDGIVVNSIAVRRMLVEEERFPSARVELCYNGLDTARFTPGPRCRPAPLAGASLVVGTLCAFRPEKDLPTLIEAFARVRALRPGLKLLLVGGGPVLPALEERARALGLDCHFEPATADAPAWMRAIDIFVLPSLSEALSNSLMEAMASGCAAVASRVGGNPELIEDGRTGLLFDAGDVAGLGSRLQILIENDRLREDLAESAAARIRRSFSLEAAARRMAEIYAARL